MKRIGLILFILAIFVLIKFSFWNAPSFFIKIGCNSETKEYSLFLETGGKSEESRVSTYHIPDENKFEVAVAEFDAAKLTPHIEHEEKELPLMVPVEEKTVPQEQVMVPVEEKTVPQEQVVGPVKEKTVPQEQVMVLVEEKTVPQEQVVSPVKEKTVPQEQVMVKVDEKAPSAATPVENGSEMPVWFKTWLASKLGTPSPKNEESPYVPSNKKWDPIPWPKLFTIRHVWGEQGNDCIPFASNYTTVEILFAPDYWLGTVMPLLDLRGHRFDNNTYAANAGIGGRYIPDPQEDWFCELLGFNAYYDYRQGCIGYYQQFGIGLEILGRKWDFRANAYAPFGRKKHIHTCVFDDYEGDFFAIRKHIESISYSFNAEAGYLIYATKCEEFSLYGAAGPYFLARAKCNDGVVGAEARLRPQYKDYVALDLSWRYDRLFQTIWQIEIILNLPLYQISRQNKCPCSITDRQIYQPIQRFEVMPLSKRTCWHTNF